MTRQLCSSLTCVALLTGLSGCGGGATDEPELAAATGTVYFEDEPVAGAQVTFVVEGKPLATATTNSEGKFTMTTRGRPGAPIGTAKVGIVKRASGGAEVDTSTLTPEDMIKMAQKGETTGGGDENELPTRYADPAKSGEEVTVDADESKNVFEFRLVK